MTNPMPEVEYQLQEGITAVKNGDREQARLLLLKVVEEDEENEAAWLWLSSVVEDEADRRACLENVLALNPDNAAARRTLLELDKAAKAGTAANPLRIPFQQHETFDDVWSRNVPLCGYCAAQVAPEQDRCPRCHRGLLTTTYRYADPGHSLVYYWSGLAVVAITFGVQVAYSAATLESQLATLTGLLVVGVLLGAAVGVYFRQSWANGLAITALVLVIVSGLSQLLLGPNLSQLGFDRLDPAIRGVVEPLTSATWQIIKVSQIIMAAIGLVLAFRAAPDFEQVQYRQIASVSKGLRFAGEFHSAAQKLAKVGLWATAVLNWQRATALEPTRLTYQRHLGEAYARLGFQARSLDVLQNARRLANTPEAQAELDALIQNVRQQAQTAGIRQTT
jgi:tetratricopeptide (TPR) repeat protein